MNSADIIVLHKFQKEYPHLIIPFGEAEWTTKSVPFNTNINILPMIQLANVKKIDFNGVYKRFNIIIDVIWSISSILLPNLQILKLSENFIITIEPLIAIKAPQIRELDLSENLITSIKPLRKCNFPCLSWLCLNRNPITNYESIAEIKFMRNCTCYLNYQH
jgi:Leucine-rich repeat (LRR) protein